MVEWKSELVQHAVAEWLICETYSNDKELEIKDLKCNFCVSYEKEISFMPSSANPFVVGSRTTKSQP